MPLPPRTLCRCRPVNVSVRDGQQIGVATNLQVCENEIRPMSMGERGKSVGVLRATAYSAGQYSRGRMMREIWLAPQGRVHTHCSSVFRLA
jgi:hypothetical protein